MIIQVPFPNTTIWAAEARIVYEASNIVLQLPGNKDYQSAKYNFDTEWPYVPENAVGVYQKRPKDPPVNPKFKIEARVGNYPNPGWYGAVENITPAVDTTTQSNICAWYTPRTSAPTS